MRALPWYSFLYRLLGAQGTFWLWILAVGAVWWTAKPALVRLVNRRPHAVAVAEVSRAAQRMIRWVHLDGVEVALDRRLLQDEAPANLPPVILLCDESDPAARWWIETRRLADLALAPRTEGRDEARRELRTRLALLAGGRGRQVAVPAPERSLLILDDRTRSLQLPRDGKVAAPLGGEELIQSYEEEFLAAVARIHERVQPGVSREGLLQDTPPVLQRRIKDEFDLVVLPYLLQVGRQPRDAESVVFGVASIVLLLLGAGLYGARSSEPSQPDPAAPAPPAEAPPAEGAVTRP